MDKTSQIKRLEGALKGLMRELEQLAPHSDRSFPGLTSGFNQSSSTYFRNLPQRLKLQRRIAAAKRRIGFLQKILYTDAPVCVAA